MPKDKFRTIGLCAAALIVVTACSSAGSGSNGGGGSSGSALSPQQVLLSATTAAQKVTSAAETLTIAESGSQSATTTGTVELQRTPTFEVSEKLNIAAAGKHIQVKAILTGTAFYLSEGALTSQSGKQWLKIDLSAMNKSSLASFAQLVQSLQSNSFVNQAALFATVKNVRVIGKETVDGVPTTEYAGTIRFADALKALSPALRRILSPELRALGNTTATFHIWIDGQNEVRKTTETEVINGATVVTTVNVLSINRGVQITAPPASETYTPPGA